MNKEDNLRYLVGQLVKCGATDNTYGRDLIWRILIRYDRDGDDNDLNDLRGHLFTGVGENKSLRWYARHLGGESCEQISQDTYNSADTVESTVHLVTDYIGEGETGTD
ncbi:MAG: hypothetical protein IH822_03055 [Chloroflexi bacterium]|nr:hypothetical protein [Chloroflexota bacterium]